MRKHTMPKLVYGPGRSAVAGVKGRVERVNPENADSLLDLERRKVVVREGRQLTVIPRSLEALVRSEAESGA
jgi:hypothetical protein